MKKLVSAHFWHIFGFFRLCKRHSPIRLKYSHFLLFSRHRTRAFQLDAWPRDNGQTVALYLAALPSHVTRLRRLSPPKMGSSFWLCPMVFWPQLWYRRATHAVLVLRGVAVGVDDGLATAWHAFHEAVELVLRQ